MSPIHGQVWVRSYPVRGHGLDRVLRGRRNKFGKDSRHPLYAEIRSTKAHNYVTYRPLAKEPVRSYFLQGVDLSKLPKPARRLIFYVLRAVNQVIFQTTRDLFNAWDDPGRSRQCSAYRHIRDDIQSVTRSRILLCCGCLHEAPAPRYVKNFGRGVRG